MIIPSEQIVGIHKKEGALVINNGESLSFCVACLADVPDTDVDFDEQRPCVICQVHGGPINHARIVGVKHDYVTPKPEIIPFSDAELQESRGQLEGMKNQRLKNQILRVYATVDYWIEQARHEAELRVPALEERDTAQQALSITVQAIDEVVDERLAVKVREFEKGISLAAAMEEAEQRAYEARRKVFTLFTIRIGRVAWSLRVNALRDAE